MSDEEAAAAPAVPEEEGASNPLPSAPSTTELLLRGERKKSRSAYQRAQKAERAYRAKKEADRAREDYRAFKSHLRTSCKELKLGLRAVLGALRKSPAVLREKWSKVEGRKEVKRVKKEEAERKKLEERLKKAEEKAKGGGEGEAAA